MKHNVFALVAHERPEPCESLKPILRRFGVDTFSVHRCADALRLLDQTHPHLIFTDTQLPDGSWIDLVNTVEEPRSPFASFLLDLQRILKCFRPLCVMELSVSFLHPLTMELFPGYYPGDVSGAHSPRPSLGYCRCIARSRNLNNSPGRRNSCSCLCPGRTAAPQCGAHFLLKTVEASTVAGLPVDS